MFTSTHLRAMMTVTALIASVFNPTFASDNYLEIANTFEPINENEERVLKAYLEKGDVVEFMAGVIGQPKAERKRASGKMIKWSEGQLQSGNTALDLLTIRAAGLALHARTLGRIAAVSGRYAGRSKKAIKKLNKASGGNNFSITLMACWHYEVGRLAGTPIAKVMGASKKTGRKLFEKAMTMDPRHAIVPFAYSAMLATDNPKKNKSKALELIADAQIRASASTGHVDQLIIESSSKLSALLKQNKFKKAQKYALQMM